MFVLLGVVGVAIAACAVVGWWLYVVIDVGIVVVVILVSGFRDFSRCHSM